ncbi:hypothetical protein M8C21_011690 [Ambrosia artemisiifolia]|uniref:Uncharacterized protein n=1 Tax=Ambrosia artemisiifolia TaxID=4212 RepID=A0AAD5D7X3_AMBAR|nr:hypothetical protein M8C21_011690 [Ambrosia artemisiifolia]
MNADQGEVVNIDDDDKEISFEKEKKLYNEWPIKEEMRNIELEKELERRMRRRGGYADRDIKHKDKVYKYSEKVSKHKGETDRLQEGEYNRGYKHREEGYRDDVERDHRHKMGQARDDTDRKKRSRDHASEVEFKNLNNGIGSHSHTNGRGGSPIYDDRVARHKDNKDVKVVIIDHLASRRYRNEYPSRDHHRVSKQEETKYRDNVYEERARHNINSNKDLSDEVCIDDSSAVKRLKSDSHLSPSSANKNSHLPPQPPYKAGSDSLLAFGSSEDDKGSLNNPKSNPVNPHLGRSLTSWNNVSNWPYVPFHHVPPPMFNPFMYPSLPPMRLPMLGGPPPMNMNNVTMPYCFTGDGFGNVGHGRTEVNEQSLEPNVVSVDLQSAVQKHQDSVHECTDEVSSGQTGSHIENEEKNLDYNTSEVMKVAESFHVSMVGKDDDALISQVYLSKIDVSKDLATPELYDQCKSMLMGFDQASSVFDECDFKILFLEEGVKDDIRNGHSLFAAVDGSVFKKAMSIYAKQKVHFSVMNTRSVDDKEKEKENIDVDHHPVENQITESCVPSFGDCEVKVKFDGSKEVDNSGDGGSLLVLTNLSTNDLTEFGSVNLSRIHSPE